MRAIKMEQRYSEVDGCGAVGKLLFSVSVLLSLTCGQQAFAGCTETNGGSLHTIGDVYIPQDAPIGSTIGAAKYARFPNLTCTTGTAFTVQGFMMGTKSKTITAAVGGIVGASLFETNVPGIGVAVVNEVRQNFICRVSSSWAFPILFKSCGTGGYTQGMTNSLYLVKTGPIAAGRHNFNGYQAYRIDVNNSDSTFTFVTGMVSGSVTVAGCSLPESVGKVLQVPLRSWERRVFKGPGSFTETVPFKIPLDNCVAGNYATNPSWNYFKGNSANIRLEGAKGSAIVNAAQGILGLNSEGTAKNVAVQILKQDGTTMPLGIEVPVMPVRNGITTLTFGARYIQTAGSTTGPEPGAANATANFTLTYK
ncbi:fimbrial protein [Pseudomonas sp. A1230]|uniref:fimbrial protein n=1 Tax=Pseudomonas sp. A1230 TaxID=3235106 RepID=UPI0037852626